jgi:hypothetical protein
MTLFRNDSPGALTLEQAIEIELKREAHRRRQSQRQAQHLAPQGRGEDTEIAHVTPGEVVVPMRLQTPEVMAALYRAAQEHDIPFEQLRVGSKVNSINPNTGVAEFAMLDDEQRAAQPQPYHYSGPPIEEVTIAAPIEKGLVQLPQNLPKSGFYNYGTPGNGAAQYGTAATMGVIGEARSQWHASGAPPFGVGNMSLSDGSAYDKHSPTGDHTTGLGADIRPIRRDGRQERVSWQSPDYDRAATQRLVDTLRGTGGVNRILFNDPQLQGVHPVDGHDDHLHVRVNPSWRR